MSTSALQPATLAGEVNRQHLGRAHTALASIQATLARLCGARSGAAPARVGSERRRSERKRPGRRPQRRRRTVVAAAAAGGPASQRIKLIDRRGTIPAQTSPEHVQRLVLRRAQVA